MWPGHNHNNDEGGSGGPYINPSSSRGPSHHRPPPYNGSPVRRSPPDHHPGGGSASPPRLGLGSSSPQQFIPRPQLWGGAERISSTASRGQLYPPEHEGVDEGVDSSSDDADDDDDNSEPAPAASPAVKPRGKPEAMAAALAAKHAEANRRELMEEGMRSSSSSSSSTSSSDESSVGEGEDIVSEAVVVGAPEDRDGEASSVVASTTTGPPPKSVEGKAPAKAKKAATAKTASKPAATSKNKAAAVAGAGGTPKTQKISVMSSGEGGGKQHVPTSTPKKKRPTASAASGGSPPLSTSTSKPAYPRTELLLTESAPPIRPTEWENLEALMFVFCKVPLLAEFSRPVSLLHPELVAGYSKIVLHPVDLGHVCRGIRRRQYKCLRDVRLDMWRVFANCVKFHSHPHNKEAVPSFVSIALHLREYFNMLWQEFMLPSDVPDTSKEVVTELTLLAFTKRSEDRRRRIENSGVLVMNKSYTIRTAQLLLECLDNGGRVDGLDVDPVFTDSTLARNADLAAVHRNLKAFGERLADPELAPEEYSLEEFYKDMHGCFEGDLLDDQPSLLNRINNRLDRLFWKRTVRLHEGNTRGVGQSSIWGNVAATIWARESSKKPFWPALCLGILPPKDQREGWHAAVTERNESRLPEKLRVQLVAAKKKCELAQKRQNLSYFLVEFLGTHEFIWVRELDIIEKFDPSDDPNKTMIIHGKKKRASRSEAIKSKTYYTAMEECKWAQEEFENVLQDALDDDPSKESEEEDDDEDEVNYSYSLLAQSDDEADDEDVHGFQYDEGTMSDSDAEEANYLLAHDGMLDVSAIGVKKKAKKKAPVIAKKKSQASSEKEKEASDALRKAKAEQLKKKNQEKEDKRELRELERRRKKRSREREKALKDEARKLKRRRASQQGEPEEGGDQDLAWDKRARATAIARAYLTRTASSVENYKSLALNGVLQMPVSMVEPTGLLGMALAFRAAAGVLSMPDESEEQIARSTKPWAAIDSDSALTSSERTSQLEIKMKLLEREIQRVRANTARRRELAEEAVAQRIALEQRIEMEDVAARFNPWKKKKKAPAGKAAGVPDAVESQEDYAEDDENIDESMMDVDEDASLDAKSDAVIAAEAAPDDEEEQEEAASDAAPVMEVVVAAAVEDED